MGKRMYFRSGWSRRIHGRVTATSYSGQQMAKKTKNDGKSSAPRIAFLHFGLGGDFWKAGGDRLFQTIKREPGWSRNGCRPR